MENDATPLVGDTTPLEYLTSRLLQGGYIPLEKMPAGVPDLLRNYLLAGQPGLKAVSISDLRNHAVRNGWEIPRSTPED